MEEKYSGFSRKEILEKVKSKWLSVDEEVKTNYKDYIDQILILKEEDLKFKKFDVQWQWMRLELDVTAVGETEYTQRTINHTITTDELVYVLGDKAGTAGAYVSAILGIPQNQLYHFGDRDNRFDDCPAFAIENKYVNDYCEKYFSRLNFNYKNSRVNERNPILESEINSVDVYKVSIDLKNRDGGIYSPICAEITPSANTKEMEIVANTFPLPLSKEQQAKKDKELWWKRNKVKVIIGGIAAAGILVYTIGSIAGII